MSVVNDVLDVLDFSDRDECLDPKAACEFLLDTMDTQGLTPADVLKQLNHQYWEIIPADELAEYTANGYELILNDVGLCGMALVAAC